MSETGRLQRQYPVLDVMRFVAALLVVTHHLIGTNAKDAFWRYFMPAGIAGRDYYSFLNNGWFIGYVGVQVFFGISGYIICVSAMRSGSPLTFFKNRLLRILPALWFCTVLATILYAAFAIFPMREIVAMFLRSVLLMPFGPYIDGVIWTIIVEMAFYSLVVVFLFTLGSRRLIFFGYGLIIASAIYWGIITMIPNAGSPLVQQVGRRLLLEHGAFFGVGIVASQWYAPKMFWFNILAIVASMFPTFLQINASAIHVHASMGAFGALADPVAPFAIWLFAVALLLISTVLAQANMFQGNYGFVRKIGLMTYPLYLIHFTVGHFLYAMVEYWFTWPLWVNSVAAICVSVILAHCIAEYIEPAIRTTLAGPFNSVFARAEAALGKTPVHKPG